MRCALIAFLLFLWMSASQAEWNVVLFDNRRYVPIENVATFYKMNLPASERGAISSRSDRAAASKA